MKKGWKRTCPHCGKVIEPKPKKIIWHWKPYHCKCVTDKCNFTITKAKVNCKNCIGLIRNVEAGYDLICKNCGYVIESQKWKKHKFCPECGENLTDR